MLSDINMLGHFLQVCASPVLGDPPLIGLMSLWHQIIRPGRYTLVTQYPRRQLQPQSAGTLQEAGLTEKQEALFLNVT